MTRAGRMGRMSETVIEILDADGVPRSLLPD
jgi:hypothetical protein